MGDTPEKDRPQEGVWIRIRRRGGGRARLLCLQTGMAARQSGGYLMLVGADAEDVLQRLRRAHSA